MSLLQALLGEIQRFLLKIKDFDPRSVFRPKKYLCVCVCEATSTKIHETRTVEVHVSPHEKVPEKRASFQTVPAHGVVRGSSARAAEEACRRQGSAARGAVAGPSGRKTTRARGPTLRRRRLGTGASPALPIASQTPVWPRTGTPPSIRAAHVRAFNRESGAPRTCTALS